MKNLLTTLSFLIALSLGAQTQFGTDFIGGGVEHFLGESLAITPDAKRLVVPSSGENNYTGSVTIYEESGNGWVSVGNKINGAATNELFGGSVAISNDGKRVAIGGYGANSWAGLVRIYEEFGGTWTQVGATINGVSAAEFGTRITISGDGKRVAASSYASAIVHVYEETAGSWSALGSPINAGNNAAISFSSDGTRLAVGNGSASNVVKIYAEIGGSWTQVGSDLSSTTATIGSAVSISADGKRVAAGGGGAQREFLVFEENGGNWSQIGTTVANTIGSNVALSGDGKSVLVGGSSNDAATLYAESGGSWTQSGTTINGPTGSAFGGSLAINHNGGRFAVSGSVHSVSYSGNEGIARTYNSPLNTNVGAVAERVAGELTVFPNPSTGIVQIQLEGIDQVVTHVSVKDVLGRVVWETVPDTVGSDWSGVVELTTNGVYVITAKVGVGMFRQQLVVAE